jgi:cullin-4
MVPARKKKKLVIKPYKQKPKLPDNYLEDTWKSLEQSVAAVHRSEFTGLHQETLYRAVEGLCGHQLGGELYKRLEVTCDGHIDQLLGALVGRSPDSVAFLDDLDRSWQEHCSQMHVIRSIFLVLDRKWVIPTRRRRRPACWSSTQRRTWCMRRAG